MNDENLTPAVGERQRRPTSWQDVCLLALVVVWSLGVAWICAGVVR